METYAGEWVQLLLRWIHLITGIAWIGSSFYFVWLDNHLTPPKSGDASGEVWSVHGGGFYHKQKYQVAPAQMPGDLHWFKWEAYFTWISGFSLLVLVYYIGARSFLIDPAKRAVIATIALPGKPEFAQADGAGHVYVNIEDKSELVEFDSHSNAVLHTWSLAPCESPSGLALDNAHHRLFSVCDNRVMAVTDALTGRQVATVAIGDGPDAVVFDPATGTIYSSNGQSGTITAVHEDDADRYTVAATIPTQKSARTMTLDPQTHRLYLSAATPGTKKNARGWPEMLPDSFTVVVVGQP